MTGAREEVLGRIGAALGASVDVPEVPRAYRQAGVAGGDVVELFCVRAADYLATVRRVGEGELAAALEEACAERRSARVVASASLAGFPGAVEDSPDIPAPALDDFDAALTGCALAVAETGSIVLDGGPESGRRALTLVPDHHLCVVRADQIVASVPDAIAALGQAARNGQPITFVSGPSATSDIELERVEGVHGPRKLDIFVVISRS
jgi:L-lactate dehydrogenase complex protein LldG